jgi:hypothetical protein
MAMPHYGMLCEELHLTKLYDARCADPLVDNAVQQRLVCSGDRPVRELSEVALRSVCASLFLSSRRISR